MAVSPAEQAKEALKRAQAAKIVPGAPQSFNNAVNGQGVNAAPVQASTPVGGGIADGVKASLQDLLGKIQSGQSAPLADAARFNDPATINNQPTNTTGGTTGPSVMGPDPTAGGGNSTAQNYIDQLKKLRLDSQIAALNKAREASLSNLGSERNAIQPKYYDARNQTAAGSQQSARNFTEFMAARGGSTAGSNAQMELSRGNQLQSNLGSLGRQEAQAYTDIERRSTDVNNAYQNDITAANAGIEADAMESLINQMNQDRSFNRDVLTSDRDFGRLTGRDARGDFVDDRNFDQDVTESNRNYDYQVGRDAVSDSHWAETFTNANKQYGEQFAYQKARDSIQDANDKRDFEENNRRYGLQYALDQQQLKISQQSASNSAANANADNARANAAAARQAGNDELAAKYDIWDRTGFAPKDIPGVAEGTPLKSNETSIDSDAAKQLETDYRGDYDWITDDAAKGLKELQDYKSYYLNKYGATKYNAMLKAVGGE